VKTKQIVYIDIYITNYYKTNKQVHILKQKTLHIYISKQLILIIKKKMEVYNYTILEEECDIDVNEKTAVEHITISSEQCHLLHQKLLHCFNEAIQNNYTHGELFVLIKGSTPRLNRYTAYGGFNTYTKNYGELDDNNGDRQRKCTTIIPGREIPFLLEDGGVTELKPFVDFVRNYSGNKMKIEWIDILRQSSSGTNGGRESLFSWHQDHESNRSNVRLTIIFLLTPTKTSMQVHGHDIMEYSGAGSGVAFMSKLFHRSVYAEDGTMKIAFFVSYKKNVTRNKPSILPGTIVKANVAKSSSSKRKIMNLVVLESSKTTPPKKVRTAPIGKNRPSWKWEVAASRCTPVPYLYKDGMYYTVEDDGEENDPGEEA